MTSKELAVSLNKSPQAIRKSTKIAIDKGLSTVKFNGITYSFSLQSNERGKIYNYKKLEGGYGKRRGDSINSNNSNSSNIKNNNRLKEEKEVTNERDGSNDKHNSNYFSNNRNSDDSRDNNKRNKNEEEKINDNSNNSTNNKLNTRNLSSSMVYKKRTKKTINLDILDGFKIENISKPTPQDKVAILGFMSASDTMINRKISILNHTFNGLNLTYRKYTSWKKIFQENGINGFIKKLNMNAKKIDDELLKKVIYSCGYVHYSSMYHYYCMQYCKKNNIQIDMNNVSSNISYSAFSRAAKKAIEKDTYLRAYYKNGIDGIENMEIVGHRQRFEVNEEWQIDATKIDFFCLLDDKPIRASAIAIIDMSSKARVWGLYNTSNSYSNVRLLKKAIEKLGKPKLIRGDNGKDYVSNHFQDTLSYLGIEYFAARPYKGRDKGAIERGFKTFQHSYMENLPGFIGHNAGERITIEAQGGAKSNKKQGAPTNTEVLLSFDELSNLIDGYFEEKYKKGFAMHENMPRIENIHRKLGKRKRVTVQRDGVRYDNKKYISYDMFAKIESGSSLDIVEDLDDVSILYLYDKEKYICEIKDPDIYPMSVEELKEVKKIHHKEFIAPKVNLAKNAKKTKNREYMQAVKEFAGDIEPIAKDELEKKVTKYKGVVVDKESSLNSEAIDKYKNINLKREEEEFNDTYEKLIHG